MEDYIKNLSKKWYKKWWGISLIFFIILFLSTTVAFALSVISIAKNQPVNNVKIEQISEATMKLADGTGKNYWLGAADPKVNIVEFGDFTCSQCQKSYTKIREIGVKYKNDVKIIFRDFPIISESAPDFAHGARCAGEQGLFWPMYDKLFANQGITPDQIREMAKQIGADLVKFDLCVNNKKYLADIQKDFEDGNKLGVSGTPTWFINGQKIEGDIPYNTFIKIIDDLLK